MEKLCPGIDMNEVELGGDGLYIFNGSVPCISSGLHGYSIRVLPKHEDLDNPFVIDLLTWD